MAKKRSSQASVLLVYLSTMLVCLVVFGSAALILLDVFVTQPAIDKENESNPVETLPVEDLKDYSYANKTVLFIGAQNDKLHGIIMLRVLPQEGKICIVPVSEHTISEVGSTKASLFNLYDSGGTNYLRQGVENAYGIKFDTYIKITDDGFNSLVEYFGGTSDYTFAQDLDYHDPISGKSTVFSAGKATRTLWGEDIRQIATYPLYGDSSVKVRVMGELAVSLINSGFTKNATNLNNNLQEIFYTIFNNSDTDVTQKSFKDSKEAYEYLLEEYTTPASYRVPKGEWLDNETFNLAPEFKEELKNYFGLE